MVWWFGEFLLWVIYCVSVYTYRYFVKYLKTIPIKVYYA